MKTKTVEFVVKNCTKNTVRFEEVGDKETQIIGSLYVQKDFAGVRAPGDKCRVRIQIAEGGTDVFED